MARKVKHYTHKKILVTGAAGSIGSALVKKLISIDSSKVILIDQAETPMHDLLQEITLEHPDFKQKIKPYIADIRDEYRMSMIFEEESPDIIFHVAAYKHVPLMEDNGYEALNTNVLGTRNIVQLSQQYNVEYLTFISTDKAVNPSGIMGATKRIAEIYVQTMAQSPTSKTKMVVTRFGNVASSNGSIIPVFEKQIKSGGPVKITHPDASRYFLSIRGASELLLDAIKLANEHNLLVFDMGKAIKIIDLAQYMIKDLTNDNGKEIAIEFVGLRPGEKLTEELHYENESIIKTSHDHIFGVNTNIHNFDQKLLESFCEAIEDKDWKNAEGLLKKISIDIARLLNLASYKDTSRKEAV